MNKVYSDVKQRNVGLYGMADVGYNTGEVMKIGELNNYRIGEIARLAGVSRRTIDYYTNLGLLEPVRSESNYRFYTDKSLLRLKIIEVLKANRFTLEEIKLQLSQLNGEPALPHDNSKCAVTIDLLKNQFKQIESQLVQLQPAAAAGLDAEQTVQMRNKIMVQSIVLVQSLLIYLNEITSGL